MRASLSLADSEVLCPGPLGSNKLQFESKLFVVFKWVKPHKLSANNERQQQHQHDVLGPMINRSEGFFTNKPGLFLLSLKQNKFLLFVFCSP
jgi:hypothetical protein